MWILAGFGPNQRRIGLNRCRKKRKIKEVANRRVKCKLACQNDSGAGVVALELQSCFPDCLCV